MLASLITLGAVIVTLGLCALVLSRPRTVIIRLDVQVSITGRGFRTPGGWRLKDAAIVAQGETMPVDGVMHIARSSVVWVQVV